MVCVIYPSFHHSGFSHFLCSLQAIFSTLFHGRCLPLCFGSIFDFCSFRNVTTAMDGGSIQLHSIYLDDVGNLIGVNDYSAVCYRRYNLFPRARCTFQIIENADASREGKKERERPSIHCVHQRRCHLGCSHNYGD